MRACLTGAAICLNAFTEDISTIYDITVFNKRYTGRKSLSLTFNTEEFHIEII